MKTDRSADEPLVLCLSALASVTRLAILRAIRVPKALREIDVRDEEHGEDPGRPLARQTVRRHLDLLIETGVVVAREAGRSYGDTTEFVLNHQRLFAIAEDVRGLAKLRATVEPAGDTLPRHVSPRDTVSGPRLVLVHGLEEGTTFPLRPGDGKREWVIGRRRECDVPLDFDPSVSAQNAILREERGERVLEDLPGSTNGTTHNFRRLAPGERVSIRHGDVVGVGRSLLLYWT